MKAYERIIVALDRSTASEIESMSSSLSGAVGVMKLGLQAFIANGPAMVRTMRQQGHEIFLDLKLHDIPNTVSHAASEAAALGVSMLTIHAAGGFRMIEAARRAVDASSVHLLAVTMLTSLDESELAAVGLTGSVESNVVRLARLARESGAHGVIASPHEIPAIRAACGADFLIVTPGIRPEGAEAGDQRRTMTPGEAILAGADYLVIGRPITDAADPAAAARRIAASMRDRPSA